MPNSKMLTQNIESKKYIYMNFSSFLTKQIILPPKDNYKKKEEKAYYVHSCPLREYRLQFVYSTIP